LEETKAEARNYGFQSPRARLRSASPTAGFDN
jgi:hypothetical protein